MGFVKLSLEVEEGGVIINQVLCFAWSMDFGLGLF